MTLPSYNVGGMVSGLDTNSIISQLMDVERIPLVRLESRRASYARKDGAWQSIANRVASLSGALASVSHSWDSLVSAESSAPDKVQVSVTGSPAAGSIAFKVDQLATVHQVASTSFTGADAQIGAGVFSITTGDGSFDFVTDADSTLADLAAQINESEAEIGATIIQIGDADFKLLLTARNTGAGSAFAATGTQSDLATTSVVQNGKDAVITVGEGAGALVLQRSSNTINDLIDGVSLTLRDTTSLVTIDVAQDVDTAVEKVAALVSELNDTVSHLKALTAYNPESGTAGVLQGDANARSLLLGIRSQVSAVVGGLGGSYTYAASVGLSLNRDGTFTLDETKLREALNDDFDAVGRLFARTGKAVDSRVAFGDANENTVDGTYAIEITGAATVGSVTGSTYTPPGVAETFSITSGAKTASVTIEPAHDLAAAVAEINQALAAAGITTLTSTELDGAILLTESRFGSAPTFTVDGNSFGLAGTHAGTDVAGTIGGESATGAGRHLTATAGDPDGLRVAISASAAEVAAAGGTLALGTVSSATGVAQRLEEFLDGVSELGGVIERARDRWKRTIDNADELIITFEQRLEERELSLIRQYASLETSLNQLAGMSTALTSQLAGLTGAVG